MFEHHFPIVNYDLRVVIRNARFAKCYLHLSRRDSRTW